MAALVGHDHYGERMEVVALVIAALSAAFAGLAWWSSRGSGQAASRSAVAAESSADASSRSARVTELALARDAEVSDVDWEIDTVDSSPAVLSVRNIGTTEAREVALTVELEGERVRLNFDAVAGGELVTLDAWEVYQPAYEARRRAIEETPGFISIAAIEWEVRVTWATPLGTPGRQVASLVS
ncbi:hypothetical protein [Demequina sp. SO4-18]|uniref:hypothetical protein n=1 Tax=Demequina sp. SO4-18 TaxID=3401026 RepID=UPI003B59EE5E